jgi:NADPH2:quinone reductase
MYCLQGLPPPWSPRPSSSDPLPLIVYGASSALGAFSIKFAKASNIHPIIAIGGGSTDYVSGLLDMTKGDTWVDYRDGIENMKATVKQALGIIPALHAVDCINSKGTWISVSQMLSPGGQLSVFSGSNKYEEPEIAKDVIIKYTYVGAAHSGVYLETMPKQPKKEEIINAPEFAFVLFRYMSRMLSNGKFEGHPYEIVPGGLQGVATGLQRLKNGEAKGRKFVYRVGAAERIESGIARCQQFSAMRDLS